jgi:hypothetical protein
MFYKSDFSDSTYWNKFWDLQTKQNKIPNDGLSEVI